MNIFKYLAPLLIAPSLTFAKSSLAQDSKPNLNQELTMYAKPAVVRIVNICYGVYDNYYDFNLSFIGTGFLINPDGYIVTSAKIQYDKQECKDRLSRNIADRYKDELKRDKRKDISKEDISKSTNFTAEYRELVILPKADTKYFPYKIKKSGRERDLDIETGEDIAIIKIPVINAPTVELGDSNKIQIQDRVITVGYPTPADIDLENDLAGVLLKLNDRIGESFFEASVTEGRISNPNKTLSDGNPVLQVDIRETDGIIGSPLLNNQGKVVGMIVSTEFEKEKENEDSIPLALPTTTIWEFIRQSGATNESGATDKFYHDGLQDYWKGNYQDARAKFLKVRGLFKNHSEVERLIGDIDQIEADWWTKPWKNPAYVFLFALLVGGGIVGAVAYFLLRQRQQFAIATADGGERSTNIGNRERSTNTDSTHNTPYKRNGKGKKCYMEMEYKGQIKRFQLGRDEHRLGRDSVWSDLDVFATWEVISRRHAILKKEGDDYRIFDGDRTNPSRNGLWVNDDFRVDSQKGHLLNNGDRLKIGQDANDQVLLTYYNPRGRNQGGGSNPRTTMAN